MESKKDESRIAGIDLHIDNDVQEICEAYNKSSGASRSVIYLLLIINILSLIVVINTHYHNWTDSRMAAVEDSLYNNEIRFATLKKRGGFTLSDTLTLASRIDSLKTYQQALIKSDMDNYKTVRIPILGNAFDTNNLGLVSGMAFIIVLVVLRFTLSRERNNLKIALFTITERYPSFDPKTFTETRNLFDEQISMLKEKVSDHACNIANEYNFSRRRYHYNYLSMNEIFNLPLLKLTGGDNAFRKSPLGILVSNYLFYFPYLVYFLVFANDLFTIWKGLGISPWHTIFVYISSFIFLSMIALLCKGCSIQKAITQEIFDNFFKRQLRYTGSDATWAKGEFEKIRKWQYAYFYAFIPIYNLYRKSKVYTIRKMSIRKR